MLALLLGGGAIYLVLGDLKEAIILLVFASMSVLITVIQEARTERVLEALRDLTSPRALVIRDGERRRIAGREVVCGDLVVLAEGDRIPADAVLLEQHDLHTDESLLTGESIAVRKTARGDTAPSAGQRPGGDDLPDVFSGALVVRGTAIGEVSAMGVHKRGANKAASNPRWRMIATMTLETNTADSAWLIFNCCGRHRSVPRVARAQTASRGSRLRHCE
jgi:Ca2+-transporting ATPase